MKKPAYIIAEIGVNHNGSLELAEKLVGEAKRAGANAVKFQTFTAETLVGKNVPKVKYQLEGTQASESHYDMIKKLELSRENHEVLFHLCQKVGIDFLSTPYDVDSAKFLTQLGVIAFKTASADLVDVDLHDYISTTKKPVFISVGMATMDEIDRALKIYDQNRSRDKVTLLHCVSNYPCKPESLNLRVFETLARQFKLPVGYSDHAEGPLASVLSIAFGATVIEKHFTLDKNLPGPDHKASSDFYEFKTLVEQIRLAETMLGSPVKKLQDEEKGMRDVSRKSITLTRDLVAGTTIEAKDLVLKRPGTGLPGEFKSRLIGKKVKHSLEANTLIRLEDVE